MASLSVQQSNPQGSIPGHSPGICHTVLEESFLPPLPREDVHQKQLPSEPLTNLWIICVSVTDPGEKQTSLFPPEIKHRKQTKGHFSRVWFGDPVSLPGLTGAQSNPKIAVLPRCLASVLTSQSCRDGISAPLQPIFHLPYILGPIKTI